MKSIGNHILLGLATALFILQGVHAAKTSANETEPWLQEQITIRSIIYVESEQFKAGSAVPLCSLEDKCAQSQQRLAFTARAEKSTWFGTAWQLSLDYHSKDGPASMKLLDRTRLLKKDHLYESVLSFDQNTGECSVSLVDLTGGEEIYQGFAFIPWEEDALCPLIGTVSSLPIEMREWAVTEGYQRIGGPILLENVRFGIHGSDPDFPRTYSTEELYAQITRPSGLLPGRLRGVIISPGRWEGEELFSHSAADAEFSTKLATSLTPGRYTVALQYCLPDYSQQVSHIIVDVVPPTIKARIDVPSALGDSTEPIEGKVLITSDCDLEGMRVTLEGELAQGTLTLFEEKILLSSNRELALPFMFVPTFRRLQLSIWSELKQMEPLQITMDWPFLTPDLSETSRVRLSSLGLDNLAPWQKAVAELFAPEFTVLFRNSNPSLRFRALDDLSYSVPTWVAPGKVPTDVAGFLPHEFESEQVDLSGLTMNLFHAAESSAKIVATGGEWNGKTLRLKFADNPGFAFSAEVIPLDSPYELELVFKFTPNQTGWYSIGFTGAPPAQLSDVEGLWQPLIWQELRFPQDVYLTTEFNCPIPTTLVSFKGTTIGVAADPSEMPYRLPTATNSRFGVALRNQKGHVQSMLFAPVLGGPESQMVEGETYTFRLRLFAYPGDWLNTYEYLARNVFGFTDYRANANGSLNDTLENMVEYALDDHYSGWDAEYRGSSYKTDVPGSVKNVSSLHPLSIALVTDREEIYHRRALPIIEYFFSRQKSLFALEEGITGQGATNVLAGPAFALSELVSLYNISQGQSTVFATFANEMYQAPFGRNANNMQLGKTWENALAMYRLTNDEAYLQEAIAGAEKYIAERIDRPQYTFGGRPFFWNSYSPEFFYLLELYEETQDPRHLQAAIRAARLFSTFIWMAPQIPEEDILVNKGGKASKYWYARGPEPMKVPEELVPAWRVSEIGLTAESSGTAHGHRAIFMANHAAYFLRLASYGNDSFLRDIGRAAVVGRYLNFPGYHMNTQRSTVYEKADYPYHEHEELTYNTFHYNHIWPHIALLFDYMVSDVFDRSSGHISFPSEFAEGYGYVRSKVYGNLPGTFYDAKDVWLYMPPKLLSADNIQVNYLVGRDEEALYIALTNSSDDPITTKITLNQDILPVSCREEYPVQVWIDNERSTPLSVQNCQVTVSLAPKGITALAIEGIMITSQFQQKVLGARTASLSEESYATIQTPVGKIRGMLIKMGVGLTSAYVYTEAGETVLRSVTLEYRVGDAWHQLVDVTYPFEFSIPVPDGQPFDFRLRAVKANGEEVEFDSITLVP